MNKLFLISGPSGSGKTTLSKMIMNNRIVTITTRKMRAGEEHGVDYFFVSLEEFEEYIKRNELIEYNYYDGNYYGITKDLFYSFLSKDNAFIIVDYNGMKTFKKFFSSSVSVFIYTDFEDTKNQLINRGENKSVIQNRLELYSREMENRNAYDYVIRNKFGRLKETSYLLRDIINIES